MITMDYEDDGSGRMKGEFIDYSMQDSKQRPDDRLKTYVAGAHLSCLDETSPMGTHYIGYEEILHFEEPSLTLKIWNSALVFSQTISKKDAKTRTLNFATSMNEEYDVTFAKKPKTIRDPMSHRIIEKRRRDRMNNCLADLSRLIPTDYLKQGQGRIEKTEIIEMAIKHIKNLTNMLSKQGALESSLPDRYLGFKECQDEVMRFLVEVEGWDAADRLCIMLMAHLEQAGEKFRIMNDQSLSQNAKEEQYRHADEELNQQPNGLPANSLEPAGQRPEFQIEEYKNLLQLQGQLPPVPPPNMENGNPIPQNYPGYEQLLTAQQITQEHLKRDKHLWTLLTSKYSPQVEDSGISGESAMSTSKSNETHKTNSEGSCKNLNIESSSSAFNSSTTESSSEKMDNSVYKFKHNITKRFSQEEKKVNPSDTSSSSSREEKRNEKVKRKIRHVRSRSPSSSGSSNYPNSNSSNNNGGASKVEKVHEGSKSQGILPGFILHPNGTHYIPLSIHTFNIGGNLFTKSRSSIYHPISIPVNFEGPILFTKKVSIQQVKTEAATQSSESMDSPSGCGSMENSVGNLSDSSPTPEQEIKSGSC